MTQYLRTGLIPAYLVLCLVLGGASAAGFWVNALLQLMALPIIAWAVLARRMTPMPGAARQLVFLACLVVLVVILQLIPLPPSIWSSLPGRGEIVSGYHLLGLPLPWLPLSVAPYQTIASGVWLLPALAVLLGIVRLGAFRTGWLAIGIVAVATLGIAIGAIQRAGNNAAYFYEITNYGVATGFFSNANHMATLLMVTVPFVAALYLVARGKTRSAQRASGLLVILAGVMGVLVVGIFINGSLAGIGLMVPVLLTSGLMLLTRKRKIPAWSIAPVIALTLAGVFLIFSKPMGNNLTGADATSSPVSRKVSFANTLHAAKDYFPTGSGAGSFPTIYPMYEDPETLTTTYVNHAHSDLLELWLETGLFGAAVLALFLLWWIRRTVIIWRSAEADQFARAATIASAAIMAHSLVDYPLRTAAISAVFALCCALMAEPRPAITVREREGSRHRERRRDGPRHLTAD